jgi:hypothetical protein
MLRIWRWYWRILGESWALMTPRRRGIFVILLVAGLLVAATLAAAMLLMPGARPDVLLGVLIACASSDVLLALARSRRKRRARDAQPSRR